MEDCKIALNAWKINPKSIKVGYTETHHGKEFRIEFEGFADGWGITRIFGPKGGISSISHDNPYIHLNEIESFPMNVKRGIFSTYQKSQSN